MVGYGNLGVGWWRDWVVIDGDYEREGDGERGRRRKERS